LTRNIYLEDIPLDEARARLQHALQAVGKWTPLSGEIVGLRESLGRVTADAVWAKMSSPHYHAAAMDGYAVNAKDTLGATETQPLILHLDDQAFAVDTGDPLPHGTNAVIMIEDVQQPDEHHIEIRASVAPRQHVRLLGEDMVETELVLPVNHLIRPVDLGALAGCGHHQVNVRRKSFVVLIPTGDELISASQTPEAGQIIEYNSLVLSAQIENVGGKTSVMPIVPDKLDLLRAALDEAIVQQPDLILILSGSSAGRDDYTASILRERGELLVHGVAVRPGHPVVIGMVDSIPVIGVPGYPVSAALTGELFIQPLIARWLGQPALHDTLPRLQATLTRKVVSPIGDDDYVRVTVAQVGERLLATPLSRGAGVITSLVRADGLAHIPRFSEGVDIGGAVEVMLYRSLNDIQRTLLAIGSHDPMLDLLGQFLAAEGHRLASNHVGSMGGLIALKRRDAHLAGIHLLDPETGEYNFAAVKKYLPNEPIRLITFAHREQGLIVAQGNPLNIQSFEDLPRTRYVNRQRGAGTRVLLDYELARRGISAERISGYEHEAVTHLEVAAAVVSGLADCGLGVRSAAIAMKLDFVSVAWERYDLAIPESYLEHAGAAALLKILGRDDFKQALGAQAGYDVRETGKMQN
jgi:putative molybdopterin biosynthesis protein